MSFFVCFTTLRSGGEPCDARFLNCRDPTSQLPFFQIHPNSVPLPSPLLSHLAANRRYPGVPTTRRTRSDCSHPCEKKPLPFLFLPVPATIPYSTSPVSLPLSSLSSGGGDREERMVRRRASFALMEKNP